MVSQVAVMRGQTVIERATELCLYILDFPKIVAPASRIRVTIVASNLGSQSTIPPFVTGTLPTAILSFTTTVRSRSKLFDGLAHCTVAYIDLSLGDDSCDKGVKLALIAQAPFSVS